MAKMSLVRTHEKPVIRIEVAYAEPHRSIIKDYHLPAGARVADALALAAADPDFTGVEVINSPSGIFGIVTRPDQTLQEGDRVEIFRPLARDPKTARRARAARSPSRPRPPPPR
jgi:putative ubiquitin-RnfH superfamily antitoxin RatB of RatAB toxin-antitoxin module